MNLREEFKKEIRKEKIRQVKKKRKIESKDENI